MKDVNLLISNGIDVNGSLDLFGDIATYNDTLKDFLDTSTSKLNDIKKYKEASDMANYAILVHSLKSDSKYLGFTKLADLSYQHEMQSKANNTDYVYANYDMLMEEANRVINIVKSYFGEKQVVVEEKVAPIVKDKSILVVDDSNLICTFIDKVFNNNFEVIFASDGAKAIQILETTSLDKLVGVLLDLNMPNVDGFAVLEYFKEKGLFAKIPVSIITGDDAKETIAKAFTYPIVDVLPKPFNERDVKRVIDKSMDFKNNNY